MSPLLFCIVLGLPYIFVAIVTMTMLSKKFTNPPDELLIFCGGVAWPVTLFLVAAVRLGNWLSRKSS